MDSFPLAIRSITSVRPAGTVSLLGFLSVNGVIPCLRFNQPSQAIGTASTQLAPLRRRISISAATISAERFKQIHPSCASKMSSIICSTCDTRLHLFRYEQELVACCDKPFKDSCNQAVADTVCGALQAGYAPIWPQCTITCPAL